jgi:glycosyltransferase involved in cell wall biosynthesis
MRRLLLVSYYFPPLAGSGVFRPLRLVKYLPLAGWQVSVVTVSGRARVLKDETLVAEVPAETRVERTFSLEPRTALLALGKLGLRALALRTQPWLMTPDDQRGWVPFAVRRAARLLEEIPHHAVLSTSGPASAHLVAREIRERCGIPWVADFRDEWTTNPYLRYPTAWHRRLNRRLERAVLTEADRVVCVSTPWLQNLRALVPDEPESKFVTLPNGYDAEHFPERPAGRPERFRIVYTGTFYGHRSPRVFLEAVRRILAEGRVPPEDLEVELVGHTAGVEGLAGLSDDNVRVVEQQTHRDAVRRLRDAAVLLLVIPPEGGAGNHTGKLFNYLAAGRPLLALAPEPNVAADLIRESRSGLVAPPDDAVAVAEAVVELHRRWRRGDPFEQDRAVIGRYEAKPQAAAYARLLDALV